QPQRSLELLNRVSGVPLIFERERQVVVSQGIVGRECHCLAIIRDGLVPGFLLREVVCISAVCLGRLREARRRKQQNKSQANPHGFSLARSLWFCRELSWSAIGLATTAAEANTGQRRAHIQTIVLDVLHPRPGLH